MQPHPTTVSTTRPEIKPRRIDFAFDEKVPRYYCDDPFMSHFFSALSVLFPAGERFFVDSVRHYRDQIEDPVLRREVVGFSAQEALHTKEHEAFNAWLDRHGYDASSMDKFTADLLDLVRKLPPNLQLAATCALEHVTATLAELVLENEEVRAEFASEELRQLWTWHALEEAEHKSVAFDVYEQVAGSYAIRAFAHVVAALILWPVVATFTYRFLRADGLHKNPALIAKGLTKLFASPGYIRKCIPTWVDYLRPGFHPTQHDHTATLEKWKPVVAAAQKSRRIVAQA